MADNNKTKVGEEIIANNGMKIKIIAYRKYNDIDIKFEDGTIVCNKRYGAFKKGEIAYPHQKRLGETTTDRFGRVLKIIKYNTSKDIDVEFEDGKIVKGRTYVDFINKKIGYPKDNRVGEIYIANNGMKMKIINYNNSVDCDVEFEDGTIIRHKDYRSVREGRVENPNIKKQRIGLKNRNNDNLLMEVVEYRNSKDIDVSFEDGVIVTHRDFYSFIKGNIKCPMKDRNGEENIANNGMKMKIINYNNSADCDIEFEDGAIVKHRSYLNFRLGLIAYPRVDHIGEENIAKTSGLRMKIIAYKKNSDVDIEFEDGTVVRHRYYQNFLKGKVQYPVADRLGIERLANNGMMMKIISYRSATDIDIEFEDGEIVKNKGYKEFLRGQIGHPFVSVHRSLPEKIICYFLKKQVDYIPSYKPDWLLDNMVKSYSWKSEIDIYIPELNVGIEYDGVRYHQNYDRDNEKSDSILDNGKVNKLFRIREEGCPSIKSYDNQVIINVEPFSAYNREKIKSLETAIKELFSRLNLKTDGIEITKEVIEACKSKEFLDFEVDKMNQQTENDML